ncbi:MAG: Tetratricopeptide 2 repeat-containing protein, partial [Bacilli bacterium]|nr:Tetratricopeptide 2 repeat-containing protein [Bacilli bacterium]
MYRNYKQILITCLTLLLMGTLSVGCGRIVSPTDAITAPRSSDASNQTNPVSDQSAIDQLQSLLPTGAKLIYTPGESIPSILKTDLNNDGHTEWAAIYVSNPGSTPSSLGIIMAQSENGKLKQIYMQDGIGISLSQLTVQDLIGNGTKTVLVEAQVGASAGRSVTLLGMENGEVKPLLKTIADKIYMDDLNGDNKAEIATWVHDTGQLFTIVIYSWDQSQKLYSKTPNENFPKFFKDLVIPYYESLLLNGEPSNRMVAYGLADTYANAGELEKALSVIEKGLVMDKNGYPGDNMFLALKESVQARLGGSSISDVTTIAPNADIIVYTNTKFNFTLKLPKSWEGKYDVV